MRNAEFGMRNRAARFGSIITGAVLILYFTGADVSFAEKWQGIDESVVEKIAKEHGREAKQPLINTDRGDLLLFVFLLAGGIGGFAAGYYWRILLEKKKD